MREPTSERLRSPPPLLLLLLLLLLMSLVPGRADEVNYRVFEELPANKLIGNLARDLNLRALGPGLTYKIVSKYEGSPLVRVRNDTGELFTTATRLDREQLCPDVADEEAGCYHEVQVVVLPNQYFRLIKVKILVEDINDNVPSFPSPVINLTIAENMPVGTRFSLQAAGDSDAGLNGIQRYALTDTGNAFTLEVIEGADGEKSPQLLIRGSLDRERKEVYEMKLKAEDGGDPPRSSTAILRVTVTDVNDNHPVFEQSQIEVKIPENTPIGTPVIQLRATDADLGLNAEVTYSYSGRVSAPARRLFQLDNLTGVITVRGPLDREDTALYRLVVLATDRGPNPVPATATVTVSVADVNDNAPSVAVHDIISPVDGVIHLTEAAPPNTPIALIEVSDPDLEQNGRVTCRIEGDVPFQLKPAYQNHENQFLLETSALLDFETKNEYSVRLVATDLGSPRMSSTATVVVRLRDENDNPPVFSPGVVEATAYENNAPGAQIVTLAAGDRDSGKNAQMHYYLGPDAPPAFRLNPSTGVLSVAEPLDREERNLYRFSVIARDNGAPSMHGNATVVIRVLDQNDNPPKFNNKEFNFFLSENLPRFGTVGVISVTDADEGKNALVTFSLVGNSDIFTINPVTGMIQSNISFDREQKPSYTFQVQAVDAGEPPKTSLAKVTIHIMDINDNAPTVLLPPSNASYRLVTPSTSPGTSVAEVMATDIDSGENAELSYSVVGGNPFNLFAIDQATGNITLTQKLLPAHQGLHRLVVRVNDAGFPESLYSIVLVNLFVNETVGNASYVQELITKSLKLPLDVDVIGDGLTQSDINRYTTIIAMVAGAMIVIILVIVVVLFLRCRGNRMKSGVCRSKENENWLSPSQQDKQSKNRKKKRKKKQQQQSQVKTAPYSIVTIEEPKSDDPTYQTINETLEELEVDCRTIPRHNTFRPDRASDSPDLAKHYRSTSPQMAVSPHAHTPPLSKNQNVIQELPADNTFVGLGGESTSKRSSTSSDHFSVSESSSQSGFRANVQKLTKQQQQQQQQQQQASRRVKFMLEDGGTRQDCCDSSLQSVADSGLGDPEATTTTTTTATAAAANSGSGASTASVASASAGAAGAGILGVAGTAVGPAGPGSVLAGGLSAAGAAKLPGSQLMAPLLADSHYERTTPDGCTGETDHHPENGPTVVPARAALQTPIVVAKDLPDVALPSMCSTCTPECQMYGHSDNCWMPAGGVGGEGTAKSGPQLSPLSSYPGPLHRPEWDRRDLVPNGSALFHHEGPSGGGVVGVGAGGSGNGGGGGGGDAVGGVGKPSSTSNRQANSYYNAFYSNNYRRHNDFLNEAEEIPLARPQAYRPATISTMSSPDFNKELYL